jgi:hypothetical protein
MIEARVLDGDRRRWRDRVEQLQIGLIEDRRLPAVIHVDDTGDLPFEHERHAQDRAQAQGHHALAQVEA